MCTQSEGNVRKLASYMNPRAKPGFAYVPTREEHLANIVTHAIVIVPSLVGLWWMLNLAVNLDQVVISWVYGLALFILFTVSTTYHTLAYTGKYKFLKEFFHIGDRAVIYLFIGASYTPWLAVKNFGGWSVLMLWIVWTCAILGIVYQYTFHEQYKCLETLLYLGVGVCPAVIVLAADLTGDHPDMMRENSGLAEMLMGGGTYIVGLVAFKCDGRVPFAHAIWHCFVFVGAGFHYSAVCKYLLGQQALAAAGLAGSAGVHAEHMAEVVHDAL